MKYLPSIVLACVLALAGCAKEEGQNSDNPYVGTWVQTAYKSSSTGTFIGQEDGTYVKFNADGTFTHFYSGWGAMEETTTGTYTMTSDMSMELSIPGETSKATVDFYDMDGNTARLQFLFFYTGTYKFEKRTSAPAVKRDPNTAKFSVSEWGPEEYTFPRYYTNAGTFGNAAFSPVLSASAAEGQITVTWVVQGETLPNTQLSKVWNADAQLWEYLFAPEGQPVLSFGETVVATATFDGNAQRREATVQETKVSRNVLWVDFGMSKSEVRENLPSCEEYGANKFISQSPNFPTGGSVFIFEGGQLAEVGEYGTTKEALTDLCYSLGLTETVEFTGSPAELSKEYTWNNGKVAFRLGKIYDVPAIGKTRASAYYYGITYRKL